MKKPSFIFNFKIPTAFLLACCFLFAADIAVSVYIRSAPSQRGLLNLYLWRGFSTLGRIRKAVLPPGKVKEGDIVRIGWIEGRNYESEWKKAIRPPAGTIKITAFGQSFVQQVMNLLPEADPRFETAVFAGPDAPINWSYEIFQKLRKDCPASIRIIGIHERELPALLSIMHATFNPDMALPYTFPRYIFRNGKFVKIEPQIKSLAELQTTLRAENGFQSFREQLKKEDVFFDPLEFDESVLDYSTLARWIRYRFTQKHHQEVRERVIGKKGLSKHSEAFLAFQEILRRFVGECRAEGTLPAVILFPEMGSGTYLKDLLSDDMKKVGAVCISASDAFDVNDPANFLKDAHYTPFANDKITKMVAERLFAAYSNKQGRPQSAGSVHPDE